MENETLKCKCGSELSLNVKNSILHADCTECDFKHEIKIDIESTADNGKEIGKSLIDAMKRIARN